MRLGIVTAMVGALCLIIPFFLGGIDFGPFVVSMWDIAVVMLLISISTFLPKEDKREITLQEWFAVIAFLLFILCMAWIHLDWILSYPTHGWRIQEEVAVMVQAGRKPTLYQVRFYLGVFGIAMLEGVVYTVLLVWSKRQRSSS
jgi:hypothetical protein